MDEICILQLGKENWSDKYTLPEIIKIDHVNTFLEPPRKLYDMVFLDQTPMDEEIEPLRQATRAYTLFLTESVDINDRVDWLCKCKKAQRIAKADIQRFLLQEVRYYSLHSYGEKVRLINLSISQDFSGSVKWNGNYNVTLTGGFGNNFRQIVFWRYNVFIPPDQVIDLWLEYDKEPTVSISLVVTQFIRGSISEVSNKWKFDEEALGKVIHIEGVQVDSDVFVSLHAKGEGKLQIIALHDRYSRGKHGYFLPGGERYVASNREEIFCYFDPGDLKPPLSVYFSGYKTRQGFEGYYMMRDMGCPFLLLTESRLEGGCFYMGTQEYEQLYINIIRKYMSELGFTSDQVILSGISMGTYGALYYGCDIRPHAMILGKPLASLGNIAANEKYLRPGGFPTSLDMLMYFCGNMNENSVKELNDKFWNKFDSTDWGKSKFITSYMLEDDYDPNAYDSMISHLWSSGVQVYGKGIHGRHNDNTSAIINWFSSQYNKILREDFSRRIEK